LARPDLMIAVRPRLTWRRSVSGNSCEHEE